MHFQGRVRDPGDVGKKHSMALPMKGSSPECDSCVLTIALHSHNWKMETVTGVKI